ncbi:hypothetical protein [Lyngbya sp. PCC 8106]|uniref:hypothetical protein n=1 Tax=Lyngbya sp. (strain PCC 8106) TaxID=313612 RepID=UPI0000EA9B4C|nr:hypothetical protein [Lyngbya sp. PCC 8106]EAW35838.1 hypothetical protein L8106_02647 [Lyngbya sp. PCC 8106]
MSTEKTPQHNYHGYPSQTYEFTVPVTLKVHLKINPMPFIKPVAPMRESLNAHLKTNIHISPEVGITEPTYLTRNGHLQAESSPKEAVATTADAANISSPIDTRTKAEYERNINHLKIQTGELEIETERERKNAHTLLTEHEKKLEDLRELHRQEICSLATQKHAYFEQNISHLHRKHALELERMKAEHEREIKAYNEAIDRLPNSNQVLLKFCA